MTKRATVIHPWLPQYRTEFFERAIHVLGSAGVELTVAHGAPPPDVQERQDDRTASWAVALPTRTIRVGGRAILQHGLEGVTRGRDLVIAEHAIRNLETYLLAARKRSTTPRLALWGHGRTYTKETTGLESSIKDRLARRAHWFFAYTAGGAAHVRSLGVPADRITVVQNSVDTEGLEQARSLVATERVVDLRRTLRLTPGRTALSLGALDDSKRLDLLVAAGREAASRLPGFTLVIAGAGPLTTWVQQQALAEPWLRYVGPIFGAAKAELAAAADTMLIAGRVGLVAVDSFALRLPIVTGDWPLHAPEFEYLVDGVNAAITEAAPEAMGARLAQLMTDPSQMSDLRDGCATSAKIYTLGAMVERFCAGVHAAIEAPSSGAVRTGAGAATAALGATR